MAESNQSGYCTAPSTTITLEAASAPLPKVDLKLKKPSSDRKVKWSSETIDNEHLNKKKSKCCCIYKKPRAFGESSSEDEDEADGNCKHHEPKHDKELANDLTESPSDAVQVNESDTN